MTGCDCPQLLLYSLVVIDSNVNNLPGEATSKEPLGKGLNYVRKKTRTN